jgi:hypothetical protein
MPNPLLGPFLAYAGRLRFPTLFKVTVGLMLVSWLWPFDPIPFIDEIVTALSVMVLANWRKPSPRAGETIDGQSRRE